MATYKGFSTQNHLSSMETGFLLTDKELVNQDLLNHIYTIPGERVMQSTFGTRISMLAFEPLDKNTLAIVEEDLRKVVDYDPRVELIEILVQALPDNNAIVAWLDLRYVQLGEVDTLRIEFPLGS